MIRVLLADDHLVLRDGLRRCLDGAGLTVVGDVGDGPEALRVCEERAPDVVLLDVSLPGLDGIETTRRLRAGGSRAAVVILTMYGDATTRREAVRAGAAAYLTKDCTTEELVGVIRRVAAGERVLVPETAGPLGGPGGRGREPVLSPREVEVLQLLAQGASTSEMARRLYISAKTVKNHLSSIYEKVDARDRTQAVLAGQRLGIVRVPGPKVYHAE